MLVSVSPTAFRLLSCRKYWSPNEALPFLRTATAIIPLHRLSSPLQSTEGRRSAAVIHLPSYSFVVSKAHLLTCRPPRPSVRPSGRFDNDCLPYRPIQLSPLQSHPFTQQSPFGYCSLLIPNTYDGDLTRPCQRQPLLALTHHSSQAGLVMYAAPSVPC